MTRSRYRIYETEYPYFLTCTVNGWLPVFTRPEAAMIIFDSWRFRQRQRQFKLYAYVILENHLHLVASAPELPEVIQRFKSHTAHKLIELLQAHNATTLLRQLKALKRHHKVESEYQLWEEGSHPKQVGNDEIMRQKIEYIHLNPVKRGYVDDPIHWRWSSARNYARLPSLIEVVTDWL